MHPEFQPLETTAAGSIGLTDWLGIAKITAPVAYNQNILVPSQEMMPFQRQFRDVPINLASTAGQRVLASGRVPVTEMWELVALSIRHDDSVDHTFRLRCNSPLAPNVSWDYAVQIVGGGTETPLYPAIAFTADSNGLFNIRGGPPPKWLGLDTLTILDDTVAVNANVITFFTMRLEILPAARLRDADELISGVAF